MKDCWRVLEIKETSDKIIINRAFRNLIRKYHPDTVASPEMRRKNTIKTMDLIEARDEALRLSEFIEEATPKYSPTTDNQDLPGTYSNTINIAELAKALFGIPVLIFFGLLIVNPSYILDPFFDAIRSLPSDNPIRILVIAGLMLYIGYLVSFFIWMAITMPYVLLVVYLSKYLPKSFEPYLWKFGWLLLVLCSLGLYNSMSSLPVVLRVGISFAMPAALLFDWIRDYIRYQRVKPKFLLMAEGLDDD